MWIKNPTPRQIALFAASGIVLAFFFLELAFEFSPLPFIVKLLIIVLVLFTFSWIIFEYALERYIYRKIKVIYKTIHRLKAKKKNAKTINMNDHVIDQVEEEVIDWADTYEKEISEFKKLEAYRRDFLGNISHELKTPIFNMQGYLMTLIDTNLEDENIVLPYIKKAANNLERLETIVQDLEAISRLESGELTLDIRPFNIKKLVQEVFDDLEMNAQAKNIQLKFKEGASHPYEVMADRENIRQVLVNLISNSIKYGKEEGRTQVGFYDMDNNILIEVADDGIGISEKHLPRLFERFYRVDKSRSRAQGGTGLGLAIVKHIIEAHKQTINVRSSERMGSTFGFTLEKAS